MVFWVVFSSSGSFMFNTRKGLMEVFSASLTWNVCTVVFNATSLSS